MAEFEHPGVFVEELERGPRPIEGVPTSTAAFLGEAERGSIRPQLVTGFAEYRRWFGDELGCERLLPDAVRGFFANGGQRLYVCRLIGADAVTAEAPFGDHFVVRAAGPGAWGNRVFVEIGDGTARGVDGNSIGFRLRVAYWSGETAPGFDPFADGGGGPPPSHVEELDDLVVDEGSPDFFGKRLSSAQGPALVTLVRRPQAAAGTWPANGAAMLAGGADGGAPPSVDDYRGLPTSSRPEPQGLAALELAAYREVALVYAPGVGDGVAAAVVEHCDRLRFRFAVVDAPRGVDDDSALQPRERIADSTRAAFYHPWIVVADPETGRRRPLPPGGHVLGVYARTDAERGVFEAPAKEVLRGAVGLERDIGEAAQNDLGRRGVNVIRDLGDRGIRVWGARTLSSDSQWKYVSVRRLLIFLERSIYEGTRWVVFEPNDERLWERVVDTIRVFLRAQWRSGALAGSTEREAFFVSCDRTTMTEDDILNGRLVCEIGVAPLRPAEFIVLRFSHH
ncbi:MAG TPA: phage tail sheath family protein, partial [Thermoanaerobaculia bacterium]|nr:phage tail sheath family protein [Thermoanaerobaculia bacterium]